MVLYLVLTRKQVQDIEDYPGIKKDGLQQNDCHWKDALVDVGI